MTEYRLLSACEYAAALKGIKLTARSRRRLGRVLERRSLPPVTLAGNWVACSDGESVKYKSFQELRKPGIRATMEQVEDSDCRESIVLHNYPPSMAEKSRVFKGRTFQN